MACGFQEVEVHRDVCVGNPLSPSLEIAVNAKKKFTHLFDPITQLFHWIVINAKMMTVSAYLDHKAINDRGTISVGFAIVMCEV